MSDQSLDRIEVAFKEYVKTGEPTLLKRKDIDYLKHCLERCAERGGHPLFAKWILEGHGDHIAKFLTQSKQVFDQYWRSTIDSCPGCGSSSKSIRVGVSAGMGPSAPCKHPWHDGTPGAR